MKNQYFINEVDKIVNEHTDICITFTGTEPVVMIQEDIELHKP